MKESKNISIKIRNWTKFILKIFFFFSQKISEESNLITHTPDLSLENKNKSSSSAPPDFWLKKLSDNPPPHWVEKVIDSAPELLNSYDRLEIKKSRELENGEGTLEIESGIKAKDEEKHQEKAKINDLQESKDIASEIENKSIANNKESSPASSTINDRSGIESCDLNNQKNLQPENNKLSPEETNQVYRPSSLNNSDRHTNKKPQPESNFDRKNNQILQEQTKSVPKISKARNLPELNISDRATNKKPQAESNFDRKQNQIIPKQIKSVSKVSSIIKKQSQDYISNFDNKQQNRKEIYTPNKDRVNIITEKQKISDIIPIRSNQKEEKILKSNNYDSISQLKYTTIREIEAENIINVSQFKKNSKAQKIDHKTSIYKIENCHQPWPDLIVDDDLQEIKHISNHRRQKHWQKLDREQRGERWKG